MTEWEEIKNPKMHFNSDQLKDHLSIRQERFKSENMTILPCLNHSWRVKHMILRTKRDKHCWPSSACLKPLVEAQDDPASPSQVQAWIEACKRDEEEYDKNILFWHSSQILKFCQTFTQKLLTVSRHTPVVARLLTLSSKLRAASHASDILTNDLAT